MATGVSILVLVEFRLGEVAEVCNPKGYLVSILVLVEFRLGAYSLRALWSQFFSFNPCSGGISSGGFMKTNLDDPSEGFNPCSGGISSGGCGPIQVL